MIVKFFKRGGIKDIYYSTGGESAKRYLLGKDYRDGVASRDDARLLAGDPDEVTDIINGLEFSKIYTSGCLAFDGIESQFVTEAMKRELMAEFEQCLFAGLDKSQYAGYWVEHVDKVDEKNNLPRLELNFVFANVELVSGKALPVYYHPIDEKRVDTFKEIKNLEMSLSDPNALERKRLTRIADKLPQNVKVTLADIDEKLTNAFVEESVNNRDEVIRYLSEHYEVTAIKNQSISIKNPHGGSRPIRLQGAFYEKTFESRGTLGAEFDQTKNHRRHRDSPDNERIVQLKADYQRYCDKRSAELAKRFKPRTTKKPEIGRRKDYRVTANAGFTYRPVGNIPAPFRDFNQYFYDFRQRATSVTAVERENRDDVKSANRADRNSVSEISPESGKQPRASSESSSGELRGTDTQPTRGIAELDDNPRSVPTEDRTPVSDHQQTPHRFFDNTVLPADIINERESHRALQGRHLERFYASDDRYHYIYSGGMGHLFGVSEYSEPGGLTHATQSSQSAAAKQFGQAVTGIAQQDGQPSTENAARTANPYQQYPVTVDTDVIDQAYAHYQAGSRAAESADAGAGESLLERINKYESTATKNAEFRQGRVSKLTRQNGSPVDRVGSVIATRRQRSQKFAEQLADVDNQLTDPSDQLAELTNVYDQRADSFIRTHRRARNLKGGYGQYAHEFKTATDELGGVIGAVSAIITAIIELFKKLFEGVKQQVVGYAKEGALYGVDVNGKQHPMNPQQAESFVGSHPYDLSGYAQLKFTAKKLEKDKELRNEPSRRLGR